MISNVCGLRDAVCYGVEIAGNEGRCGMVSIADPDQDLDLIELANAVTKSLPSYARPVFIRTLKKVELTGVDKKEFCFLYIFCFIHTCFNNRNLQTKES